MSSRQYLIADADPGQRQLLDLLLSDGESTIAQVETARQALEFLRTNTPALVVLAYELPGMPGTEVCKRLKLVARLQHVPVIVTVDPGEAFGVPEEVRVAAEDAGVDLLVPKPLGDKALRERATRLILAAEMRQARSPARARHDTGVIEQSLKELDARQSGGEPATPAGSPDGQAEAARGARGASRHAGADEAEVERLRTENAKLKQRLLALQDQNERLRSEVEELKRSSRRGLFGRRR